MSRVVVVEWFEGLSPKQRTFCEAYASNGGNATAAARDAGYQHPGSQGAETLKKLSVRQALEKLREATTKSAIMTREERQQMWSEIARDRAEMTKDRLKAAELLGRSQADFIERVQVEGEIKFRALPDDELDAELAALAARVGALEGQG